MTRLTHAAVTLAVVVVLTALKGYVYLGTGSLSVLSEFFDSILDIVGGMAVLYAIREGTKPPDSQHPYGHGKFESLIAYTVAIFTGLAGFYIITELVQRLIYGHSIKVEPQHLTIILATIIVDGILAAYNYLGYTRHGSVALRANFVNYLGDAARGTGVLIALMFAEKGSQLVDVLVAAVLVAILFREAYSLVRESSRVLLDEAPQEIVVRAKIAAKRVKGVVAVKRVRARCMGNRPFIDIIVVVPKNISIEEAHRIADKVEEQIRREVKDADVVAHVEPAS